VGPLKFLPLFGFGPPKFSQVFLNLIPLSGINPNLWETGPQTRGGYLGRFSTLNPTRGGGTLPKIVGGGTPRGGAPNKEPSGEGPHPKVCFFSSPLICFLFFRTRKQGDDRQQKTSKRHDHPGAVDPYRAGPDAGVDLQNTRRHDWPLATR